MTGLVLLSLGIFQVTDTVVVRANQPPAWGDDATVVEEVRIGMLEGPIEYTFGNVRGVAIGPDGSVYVADHQVPAIRRYGPDGEWLGDVGGEGQGPGEYRYLYGIERLPGGPLVILDPSNARVTHYRDSRYLRSFPSLSGLHSTEVFAVDTAGNSYVKAVVRNRVRGQRLPSGAMVSTEEWPKAWIVLDSTGVVVDTLDIPMENEEGGGFVLAGTIRNHRPFSVMTVSAVSPHGYQVWARNDEYALFRPLSDGRLLRIERDAERVPLKRDEKRQWEEWVDYVRETSRRDGIDEEYGPIPDEKPFIRHLFVDDDARIWVGRYAEAEYRPYTEEEREERGDRPGFEWRQTPVWDVISPEGQFLAQLLLPPATDLAAARGSTVWGVQVGEYDEEYVVRLRITGSGIARVP